MADELSLPPQIRPRRYGVVLEPEIADPAFNVQIEEADEDGANPGQPDLATLRTIAVLPAGEDRYTHYLPNDGALRLYRGRHVRPGWTPGAWTADLATDITWVPARPVRLDNRPTSGPRLAFDVDYFIDKTGTALDVLTTAVPAAKSVQADLDLNPSTPAYPDPGAGGTSSTVDTSAGGVGDFEGVVAFTPDDVAYTTISWWSAPGGAAGGGRMIRRTRRKLTWALVSGAEIPDDAIEERHVSPGAIIANHLQRNIQLYGSSIEFSSSSRIVVSWGAGDIVLADGTIHGIAAGSLTMGSTAHVAHYIYWPTTGTTLSTTTDLDTAFGDGNLVICVAWPGPATSERAAYVPPFGLVGLNSDSLLVNSVKSDSIQANAVQAIHIAVISLSAISADMGTLTAGRIYVGKMTIDAGTERILFGDATAPLTGTGIFIGKDGTNYELRAGNPSGEYIHWDGTNLTIVGGGTFSGALSAASGTFAGTVTGSDFTATTATFTGSLKVEAGLGASVFEAVAAGGVKIGRPVIAQASLTEFGGVGGQPYGLELEVTAGLGSPKTFRFIDRVEMQSDLLLSGFTTNITLEDAGTTGATEAGWIEIDQAGTTRYLRVYSSK